MANEVTTARTETIEVGLAQMEAKFAAALPAHIPASRFVRTALSALADNEVRKCAATPGGRKSIYDACLKAAADGLLLDKREAALVRYSVKKGDGYEDHAQYMPMVAGLMKKARNSGEVASIMAQVVHSNDEFEINYVTDGCPITHKPDLQDRGAVLGAYAIARLKDGTWTQPEYLSVQQIELVRQRSKAKDKGPWVTDWAEMARKTAIRRASKYWPSSTDKDGVAFDEIVRRDDEMIELTAEEMPAEAPLRGRKRRGAAAQILAEREVTPAHDADTGEITEEDSPDV
jgi:recombination protein RecT